MQVNHTPSATRTLLAPPSPLFGVVYIVFWILLMLAEHLSIEPDCAALSLIANLVHLFTKMRSLSVHEPSYLILYSQCQRQFPDIMQNLPVSELFQAPTPSSVFFYPGAPTVAPPPTPTSAPTISDLKSAFFSNWNSARIRSCAFRGPLYGGGRRIQRSYQDH